MESVDDHEITRAFWHDTAGRRIGTIDPDSDSQDPAKPFTRNGWRYLFNRVGDLIAVRDARGCGQNFYYDHAGRLVAEDYVECDESEQPGSSPDTADALGSDSFAIVGQAPAAGVGPDVRHYFDEAPHYASSMGGLPSDPHLVGRLSGSVDRAQRSAVAYDPRGRPVWSARQMVVLPGAVAAVTSIADPRPTLEDGTPSPAPVGSRTTHLFDTAHTYVSTSEYDRVDRPVGVTLPEDPDFGTGPAPEVGGRMTYDELGLPKDFYVGIGTSSERILTQQYNEARLPSVLWIRNAAGGSNVAHRITYYDDRLRPTSSNLVRGADYIDQTPGSTDINSVRDPFDFVYSWDVADNLWMVRDNGHPYDTPAGIHPSYESREATVTHDALYRVIGVDYRYLTSSGWSATSGPATDWRAEQTHHQASDPMRRKPAPMVSAPPGQRPVNFTYQYDWLANQTEWTDDQSAFYERSLGTNILNGHEATSSTGTGRPAALYLASNLPTSTATGMPSIDRGGWVSLEYGESGNVLSMTARGQCHDVSASVVCIDDPIETDPEQRGDDLATGCACDVEHHYQYRWDELNRLAEARRYDRGSGLGTWELQVRQRYRYDGANVRMIKETDDAMSGSLLPARTALYVYPGDFERRGLLNDGLEYLATMPDGMGGTYDLGAETQYLIAGARLTWKEFGVPGASGTGFDKEARLTYAVPDLIQSTSAVIDLYSGQLVEEATYYPNGARETLRTERGEGFSLEPMGFTGKEGDDEVGLVYFGERYLIPHLGRWATPDPLQVHAGGGGEFGNSYHYVSGNLLDARDPLGLDAEGLYRLLVDDGTYDLSESKRERLVFNAGSSRPGEGNLTQTREGRKAKLIVPSSNSGATAGWGYDGASRSAGEIRRQMQNARVNGPATGAMAAAAGLRGADAERSLGPMAQRPEVSYDEADRLFFQEVRPGYETMARNRFSITGGRWNALDPSVREALVDVVYNWNAVADDTHREMRTVMSNQNLSTIQQLEGLRDAHAAGRDRAGNPVFTRMNAYATVFLQSRIEEIESDQMFDETIDHYRSLPMEDAPDAPEPMPEP